MYWCKRCKHSYAVSHIRVLSQLWKASLNSWLQQLVRSVAFWRIHTVVRNEPSNEINTNVSSVSIISILALQISETIQIILTLFIASQCHLYKQAAIAIKVFNCIVLWNLHVVWECTSECYKNKWMKWVITKDHCKKF